ncbi:MAG: hypothetical protein NC922_08420 [Candidatus Omnitrophica bacterium]|nr:hypothetical protein [Candidatus Omnitrophota bacterium]
MVKSVRYFLIFTLFISNLVYSEIVDEPLGARYSLGMTLWHMGHNPEMILKFHQYLKDLKYTPEDLIPSSQLKKPESIIRILVEPELLGLENLGGWKIVGDRFIESHWYDAGPTCSIPLKIPKAGIYRFFLSYYAWVGHRGVTFIKFYKKDKEYLGPIFQMDEFYDKPPEKEGIMWKDMLVDLPEGDLVIKLGHVTPWWHSKGGYAKRRVDCFYLTEEIWKGPPTEEDLRNIKEISKPEGIQWTINVPLNNDEYEIWKWWQIRPISWEDREKYPKLFELSKRFWEREIDELSKKEYDEKNPPDYREPERQVVFNEIWNMVANPVRARRQIKILEKDITKEPIGYNYIWHDVGGNIEGLREDGNYEKGSKYEKYGNWYGGPGCLKASYGNCRGTVSTEVEIRNPGTYYCWILSDRVNLSYSAPYFCKAYVDEKEQFIYHHQGKIPSIWIKMGEIKVEKPGKVRFDFILDGAGSGETYRRIYTLFLIDDPNYIPHGTVRPPWTIEMYMEKARKLGAKPGDKLLLWLQENPYRRLSQEVWADKISPGDSWPYEELKGRTRKKELLMAQDTYRAVSVGIRNLTEDPIILNVKIEPLKSGNKTYPGTIEWRVQAFVPYGVDRQAWTPFFLLRRPYIIVPPLNVAGIWITVNTKGLPPGDYSGKILIFGKNVESYDIILNVKVANLKINPERPVLIYGWSNPHEGEAYIKDFVEHGMNVWSGEMKKEEMKKWGIRLLAIRAPKPENAKEFVERIKNLGLDYEDYFVMPLDEPCGKTETELIRYIEPAKAIKQIDPKIRIAYNPGEAATLETFKILAPYCDFWIPYSLHVFSPYYDNPKKKEIYLKKPWMWYTTPCLWDKTAREPGIRLVPSQPGNCVGVAFFALNYPWRDQWDTAYEHIPDASTMGHVISRHGPIPTIIWEEIREAAQTANLAMMIREKLGAKTFDDVKDPEIQKLIKEGTDEQLIRYLINK